MAAENLENLIDEALKSNMDRFIEKLIIEKLDNIATLKSNMDRFIDVYHSFENGCC
mgnify:FL=1